MSTAQARTATAVRSEILSGDLRPGGQLIQEEIAERYGVSRIPVREALQALASEGLVTYIPNRGYFVAELSVDDLVEVYRLRQILETEAIGIALNYMSDDDRAEVKLRAAEVEEAAIAGDVAALTAANRAFHFAVFSMAGMPRLMRLLQQLWDASEMYRAYYFQQDGNRKRILAEHLEILEAVMDRDVGRTISLQDAHREHSVAWLRTQLLRAKEKS